MSSDVTVPVPHRATITLSDVAREAGVSIATASFVLSGRGGSRSAGSPATKAKVRAAAEALGYVPNRNAQAMRTGRGGGIVLALGTLDDPWGVQLATQVREDALPHDLSTLVLADERWVEYLSGASADAAFITSVDFVEEGPERVHR
ncbi:MAG: LacI family DNA-binding transcriptional regulator, partial [Brachybacterium tyrofermentans]